MHFGLSLGDALARARLAPGASCSPRCFLPSQPSRPHGRRSAATREQTVHDDRSVGDERTRATLERLYLWDEQTLHALRYRAALRLLDGPPLLDVCVSSTTVFRVSLNDKPPTKTEEKASDYYANVGDAIRTLRDDVPRLFKRDLDYHIYRDDITFKDPRNTFAGIKNYRTIFWSLRFHGSLFFSSLYVDIKRIWQPPQEDKVIKMRWTVHGIPRVPWEAKGIFDGISTYKLDRHGKIYEHAVDNILLRDPPFMGAGPHLIGLNLLPQGDEPMPLPGLAPAVSGWWSVSWYRLYMALFATVLLSCAQLQPAPLPQPVAEGR